MKNEYKVTKKLMQSWAKEYHLHGKRNVVLFILWCIVGVVGLFGTVFAIAVHSDRMNIYLYVICTLLAVYRLVFSRFAAIANRYKMLSRTYGVEEWIRTTEFLDDDIVLTDHTSVFKLKYTQISKIKETDKCILIFFKDYASIRLYKDAFVEGSWQDCLRKIAAKNH